MTTVTRDPTYADPEAYRVHFGAAFATVHDCPAAVSYARVTGDPCAQVSLAKQLVTPAELRALADYIEQAHAPAAPKDPYFENYGGTD